MKKLFLVVFTLFFVSSVAWAQNAAEKNVTGKTYTQAEKERLDLIGHPATDWSVGTPHNVTGIVKWSQGFEGTDFPPAGWAMHQLDGGANPWIRYTTSPIFGTASASVRWESATLANDDWLVTPSFLVDAADKLNFYAVGSSSFTDSIIVYASTAGGVPPAGYTRIAAFRPLAAPAQRFEVSLAAFGGQTIYLAFQYKELDQLRLYLDSVYVETGVPNDVGMVSHNVGGELNGGTPLTPTATVKNFGSATQTFNVTMTINPGGYTSTKQVASLAADQTANVTFDSWTPTAGSFTAKAYTQLAGDQNPANDTLSRTALVVTYIYDNGPLVTNPGGGFGGADLSALQNTVLNILGYGSQISANNWITDDFTVPANETWSLDAIKFFSYQTGSTTTSTFNGARVVIYNGRPDLPTSTVVFGDETTERYISSSWTGAYRATVAAPTGNTRPIMGVLAGAPTVLGPGNYWVMYTLGGTLASGPWAPPISILGTYETGNAWARQAGTWLALRDSVTGGTGYAQGIPFKLVGSVQAVPVELTSFMATVLKNNVTLLWSTATETNNMGFQVERKAAGGEFQTVGYVNGNGTTTEKKEYAFTDAGLGAGKYTYRLRQVDFDGTSEYSSEVEADIIVPAEYSLGQNYPNPFNPSTSIEFALKADAKVTLRLFDALGQEVRTILSDNYATGNYKIDFNASSLNSGVYFYTIEASGVDGSKFTSTKKMILMK